LCAETTKKEKRKRKKKFSRERGGRRTVALDGRVVCRVLFLFSTGKLGRKKRGGKKKSYSAAGPAPLKVLSSAIRKRAPHWEKEKKKKKSRPEGGGKGPPAQKIEREARIIIAPAKRSRGKKGKKRKREKRGKKRGRREGGATGGVGKGRRLSGVGPPVFSIAVLATGSGGEKKKLKKRGKLLPANTDHHQF